MSITSGRFMHNFVVKRMTLFLLLLILTHVLLFDDPARIQSPRHGDSTKGTGHPRRSGLTALGEGLAIARDKGGRAYF